MDVTPSLLNGYLKVGYRLIMCVFKDKLSSFFQSKIIHKGT